MSEKLFTPIKDSSFEFGEENNAWVTWVAEPLLCYYQETSTLKEVGVQLFISQGKPGRLPVTLKAIGGEIPLKQKITDVIQKNEWLLPLFIFLLFLAVSLPGVSWGAPALWNPDELIWRVDSALRGEMVFDVSEPDFNYPSLPKYVMYAIGWLVYGTGRSSFAFIVAARSFSCFLGALSGALIYSTARMIGANKRISTLAGLLYVASGVAAANGRFAHNDLYLQLFSILCVFFIIKYQYTHSLKWLYVSFFCVGLAASSKFTGGSLILLPVAVYVAAHWTEIRSRWLSMIGILFLGGVISLFGVWPGHSKGSVFSDLLFFACDPCPAKLSPIWIQFRLVARVVWSMGCVQRGGGDLCVLRLHPCIPLVCNAADLVENGEDFF
ncbi:MAG: phospholipid carrier-dependent glycosyltransferase [Anaerolineales bacterium]|nr:phospholipid carrier-dependent glycosyltransferase [Anaerolineales bacterium]